MGAASLKPAPFVDPEGLVGFLDALRAAGYGISTNQYIAAQDLVLSLAARRAGAGDPDLLKRWLRPLLCRSAKEQAEFGVHFERWRDRLLPGRLDDGTVEAPVPQPLPDVAAPPPSSLDDRLESLKQQARRTRRRAWSGAVAGAVALVAWAMFRVPEQGVLAVNAEPDGATVRIVAVDDDGTARASSAPDSFVHATLVRPQREGKYRLEFRLAGHADTFAVASVTPRPWIRRAPPTPVRVSLRALGRGELRIGSRPGGAQVFLDGKAVGTTPLDGALVQDSVIEGNHVVRLTRPGHRQQELPVVMAPGRTESLEVTLLKVRTGRATIVTRPPGARVFIDGKERGTSRAPIDSVEEGPHQLRLSLAGHRDFTTTVPDLISRRLEFALVPSRSLQVTSLPPGAAVFVDDVRVGVTPVKADVPLGDRRVRLQLAEFEPAVLDIGVTRDTTAYVELRRVERPYTRVAFSPDGLTMAVGPPDGIVRLWSLGDRWAHVGTLPASASRFVETVNDVETTARRGWFPPASDGAFLGLGDVAPGSAVFTPEGTSIRFLTAGNQLRVATIEAWERCSPASSAPGRCAVGVAGADTTAWQHVAFDDSLHRMVGVTNDSTAIVIVGERAATLLPHPGAVLHADISRDGRLVATVCDCSPTIRLWDAATGDVRRRLEAPAALKEALRFNGGATALLAVDEDDRGLIWDLTTTDSIPRAFADSVASLDASPDGRWFLGSATGDSARLRVFSGADGTAVTSIPEHVGFVFRIGESGLPLAVQDVAAISPDGIYVATATSNVVKLWSVSTGDSIGALIPSGHGPDSVTGSTHRALAFSRDGRRLLQGTDSGLVIWDHASGTRIGEVPMAVTPRRLLLSHDDRMVLVESESSTTIWRLPVRWEQRLVQSVTINQAADRLAFAAESLVIVRTIDSAAVPDTAAPIVRFAADTIVNDAHVTAVVFSDDGRFLAVGDGNGHVRLEARAADGTRDTTRVPMIREAHRGEVHALAFTPDGSMLASAAADKFVVLWDTRTMQPVDSLRHDEEVEGVAFTPDGARLASSGASGRVRVWRTWTSRAVTAADMAPGGWPVTLAFALLAIPAILGRTLWTRRAQVLVRRQSAEPPRIDRITLAGMTYALFPQLTLFRTAVRLRRRVEVPSTRLDISATVDRTIQRGGVFTPSYARQLVTPEYLALIDRTTLDDQQAAYIDELLDRLVADDVFITRYYFDGDPRVCLPRRGTGNIEPASLRTLAQRFAGRRLLLFAEAKRLFSPVTGQPEVWTDTLRAWPDRSLLTSVPPAQWGAREASLAQAFGVYHTGTAGLALLAASRGRVGVANDPATSTVGMPLVLQRRPGRWIEREAPPADEIEAMLEGVKAYLGPAGFLWFVSCAVYPSLHWKLTLNLGHELRDDRGERLLDADRLLAMARLPWFRHGAMPDWLRTRLCLELAPEREHAVRTVLESLLVVAAEGGEEQYDLEIASHHAATLHRFGKSLLRVLQERAPEDHALRDHVFVEFMRGGRASALAVRVPGALQALLANRGRLGALPARSIADLRRFGLVLAVTLPLLAATGYGVSRAWGAIPATPLGATLAFDLPPDSAKVPALVPDSSDLAATKVDTATTPSDTSRAADAPTDGVTRPERLVTSTIEGANFGTPFRHTCTEIAQVRVRAGWWVDGVQLVCRGPGGLEPRRLAGGAGGGEQVFALRPGEIITAVSGTTEGPQPYLYSLQFHTNQRSSPKYGESGPERGARPFRLTVPPGDTVRGLAGAYGDFLFSIGIVYATRSGAANPTTAAAARTNAPLSLVEVTPPDRARDVGIDAPVSMIFSRPLTQGEVSGLVFPLTNLERKVAIALPVVRAETVTFVPRIPLMSEGSRVRVELTVQDGAVARNFQSDFSVARFDPRYLYYLHNGSTGPSRALDTYSDAFTAFMSETAGNFSGQRWYVTPADEQFYLMRNTFKGDAWYLEGGGENGTAIIQQTGSVFSGQMWRFASYPGVAGCLYVQNAHLGSAYSLANVNGAVVGMRPTSTSMSQCWVPVRIGPR